MALVAGMVLPFSAGMAAPGVWWGRAALTRRRAGGIAAWFAVVQTGALRWTVTVDASGLTVRSALGPRVHVPLAEVEGATVTQVAPIRQFGAGGRRVGAHGATATVTRKGESLEVARSGNRRVVVTVDDAATGAALPLRATAPPLSRARTPHRAHRACPGSPRSHGR